MAEDLVGLLQAAVENARDGVTITSADIDAPGPTILYVNPAFTKITGYSSAEVVGKSPRILQGPKTDRHVIRRLRSALESDAPFFGETTNYRKDGTEFRMQWQLSPISTNGTETTHWIAVQRDVTEQRQAEQETRELQENWLSVIQTAPDFILLLSREGDIRFINRTLPHLSLEQVLGSNAFSFIEPKFHKTVQEAIDRVHETAEHAECEFIAEGIEGNSAWYNARLGPCWSEGKVEGVVFVACDISKRKRAEELAHSHQEQLMRVLRLGTMGEMASSLSHELHQPLTAIANYSRGGVRALQQENFSTAQQLDTLQCIGDQALVAGEIVRRWKRFIAKEKPNRSTVDINELLVEIVEFVRPYSVAQQTEISLDLAAELPNTSVDRIQIQQVIVNLLNNAAEAMQGSKSTQQNVVIKTAYVEGELLVRVVDQGPGMDEASLQKAFEPYFTTKEDGLGMGLSISRTIIESHRGKIWGVANLEQGMTFCFTLPPIQQENL